MPGILLQRQYPVQILSFMHDIVYRARRLFDQLTQGWQEYGFLHTVSL